jgi:hypothetical protein
MSSALNWDVPKKTLFFFFFFFFLCLVLWLAQLHYIAEVLVVSDGYVPHLKCFGNTIHSKLKYPLFLQAPLFFSFF